MMALRLRSNLGCLIRGLYSLRKSSSFCDDAALASHWRQLLRSSSFRDRICNRLLERKAALSVDEFLRRVNSTELEIDDDYLFVMHRNELSSLPNSTHPSAPKIDEENLVVKEVDAGEDVAARLGEKKIGAVNYTIGELPCESKKYVCEVSLTGRFGEETLGLLRSGNNLTTTMGVSAYVFKGALAQLERALVRWAVQFAEENGFSRQEVPEILPTDVIEKCGFPTRGSRSQVFHLDEPKGHSLIGTAEMSIAASLQNRHFSIDELPARIVAESRCYRAEKGNKAIESGLYRVHQFTKVEMFVVSTPEASESAFGELVNLQMGVCESLQLPYRLLEMSAIELGLSAYRKADIEVWMPVKEFYGEVSSASNCTDFQSSRLNITCDETKDDSSEKETVFAHTLNGTALAVPRVMMAILEYYQNFDGSLTIPKVIRPYMNGVEKIYSDPLAPKLKTIFRVNRTSKWLKTDRYEAVDHDNVTIHNS